MAIMHRKYLALEQYHCNYNNSHYHYNNSGRDCWSAVTPTVIVALSAHHALSPAVIDSDSKQSLQEEEERPRVAQAQDYLCF